MRRWLVPVSVALLLDDVLDDRVAVHEGRERKPLKAVSRAICRKAAREDLPMYPNLTQGCKSAAESAYCDLVTDAYSMAVCARLEDKEI